MLLSRAEQAKLGLYHAYNQDPEPHSSAFLANLVSFMVSKLQPTLKTHTLIELCCRDFEFAQDYANGPAWSIWGIDLKDPESTDFRTRGTSADPSFTFTKADVFASTPESGAVPRTDEPRSSTADPPSKSPSLNLSPRSKLQMSMFGISLLRGPVNCKHLSMYQARFRSANGITFFSLLPLRVNARIPLRSYKSPTDCSTWHAPQTGAACSASLDY